MTRARRLAAIIYGVCGAISVVLGAIYLFRARFMPYHGTALEVDWEALDPPTQTLLLALMDVAGAGWAVTGLLVLVLVAIPFRAGERWARWTVPATLALLYVPILLATLRVLDQTPATPPWYGNAIALGATITALIIDRPWRHLER
ncbi:MAG: hypothetical protein RIB53_13060 [Roseitalea porphyridii]|jgi:uncharacterized membrane protein YqjE|uniref:hypothetical protein n=1 Tax=Roseitalea porphyridii TaxID=1852022 RepID=UPI0032EE87D1